MRVSLRAGEKIYINGAVLCVDRKVSVELLNDVTFLLQSHVIQASDANTPLRQIYFAMQLMLMEPNAATTIAASVEKMFADFEAAVAGTGLAGVTDPAQEQFRSRRLIDALKTLRALFPVETEAMAKPARDPGRNSRGELECRSRA
jgi:flagellar biosynthesis repressor protein FlbT